MNDNEWRAHCEAMEAEHPSLHDFLETWGKHCGAPRAVFRGHLCKMIDAIWAAASPSEAEGKALSLLRAWVAGCGDERYSTKEQVKELINKSGEFLASLGVSDQQTVHDIPKFLRRGDD